MLRFENGSNLNIYTKCPHIINNLAKKLYTLPHIKLVHKHKRNKVYQDLVLNITTTQ